MDQKKLPHKRSAKNNNSSYQNINRQLIRKTDTVHSTIQSIIHNIFHLWTGGTSKQGTRLKHTQTTLNNRTTHRNKHKDTKTKGKNQ